MTAYEMRISDWSSDVCSSDLADAADGSDAAGRQSRPGHGADGAGGPASRDGPGGPVAGRRARAPPCPARRALLCHSARSDAARRDFRVAAIPAGRPVLVFRTGTDDPPACRTGLDDLPPCNTRTPNTPINSP